MQAWLVLLQALKQTYILFSICVVVFTPPGPDHHPSLLSGDPASNLWQWSNSPSSLMTQ